MSDCDTSKTQRHIFRNTLLIFLCILATCGIIGELWLLSWIIHASTPQEATGPNWRPPVATMEPTAKERIIAEKGLTQMAKFNTNKVKNEDLPELVGQLLDIFEDFLAEKGIEIENPEKQEAINDGEDPDSICILYGTDYGDLQSAVEETLINWKLAEPWQ